MTITTLAAMLLLFHSCTASTTPSFHQQASGDTIPRSASFKPIEIKDSSSWTYFLQHLPTVRDTPVLDYMGRVMDRGEKSWAVIPYDVGARDLQQCADAIMRLRAEYLFQQKRFSEISFHFTDGQLYRFSDYCKGLRPLPKGNRVVFVQKAAASTTHDALRRYLDLVYTYAGTISLEKELKPSSGFGIGTVVIYGGSPGHCFIIIDEAKNEQGRPVYKLAEGYTPAQSIYVLRNPSVAGDSPWHELNPGPIQTASYRFDTYQLKQF